MRARIPRATRGSVSRPAPAAMSALSGARRGGVQTRSPHLFACFLRIPAAGSRPDHASCGHFVLLTTTKESDDDPQERNIRRAQIDANPSTKRTESEGPGRCRLSRPRARCRRTSGARPNERFLPVERHRMDARLELRRRTGYRASNSASSAAAPLRSAMSRPSVIAS